MKKKFVNVILENKTMASQKGFKLSAAFRRGSSKIL